MEENIGKKNKFSDGEEKTSVRSVADQSIDNPASIPQLSDGEFVQAQMFEDNSIKNNPLNIDARNQGQKISKNKKGVTPATKSVSGKGDTTIANGYKLEYRMKRLLFYMGYFPKIGIDILTSSDENADKITDLDVYGIYVHKDFTSKTTWVDCKSGGVEIHKRISWIKGIMGEIHINDMIFVAGGARTSVKQYARKAGIQILDLNIIEKLEKDYGVDKDDWRGSWNPNVQYNKINDLSKLNIHNGQIFKKIARFISSDYWVLDNYTKSKRAITALRELSSAAETPINREHQDVIKWGIYELVCLFLLSLLNISKELYYFSDNEKKETIHDGLTSSDIPNKRRAEMFDTAFKVAYGLVKNQYPDIVLPQKMPYFNLTPPSYFEAYHDLILRITNNPLNYYDLLRFLDFVLMEYDLQSKEINSDELKKIFQNYSDLLLGAKTLLNFVCQITNVPRTYFKILAHQIPSNEAISANPRTHNLVKDITSVKLTGNAGTGERILKNWNLFSFEFDNQSYTRNSQDGFENHYPYKIKFGDQIGHMNIIVEDKKISSSTVIDCDFEKPLGAYNDTTNFNDGLYEVARRMLRESGIKTNI